MAVVPFLGAGTPGVRSIDTECTPSLVGIGRRLVKRENAMSYRRGTSSSWVLRGDITVDSDRV
jgi:hypothetical protein